MATEEETFPIQDGGFGEETFPTKQNGGENKNKLRVYPRWWLRVIIHDIQHGRLGLRPASRVTHKLST